MTDIVDRLRRLTNQGEDYIWRPAKDAIAEIERLRALVLEQEGLAEALGGESAANERTPILKDTQHE